MRQVFFTATTIIVCCLFVVASSIAGWVTGSEEHFDSYHGQQLTNPNAMRYLPVLRRIELEKRAKALGLPVHHIQIIDEMVIITDSPNTEVSIEDSGGNVICFDNNVCITQEAVDNSDHQSDYSTNHTSR